MEPSADPVAVMVSFEGPKTGKLVISTCRSLLPILAANILGDELQPTELQQMDALGEVANIVCGNVLPAVFGPKDPFLLGPPRAIDPAAIPADPAAEVRLVLEERPVELRLFVN
jgi:hypothetical protein